jgi:hypothetical protein
MNTTPCTSPPVQRRGSGFAATRATPGRKLIEWATAARQDTKPSTLLAMPIRSLPDGAPDWGDIAVK